ncbi:LL-diaminopimelate aminotransferase apoenzyme [Oceanobacillus limi]|uniref:Aminotransferase n=1 Tax=Oceanobacillus limi TaxID=930131 RepID=A0A1I0E0K2_9BACI|nr:aminotransferase class I/II-fold pyridoxal phosphate-dependent enzyme [Oceanobacillus limi]SET38242.1 LL-diaminopimelate aminotransferase apoenzyme [Oceanobacillus limi]
MHVSDKVKNLPPYLFSEFQRKKKGLQAQGVDVIDLGIGAPDLPTPEFIIDTLVKEVSVSTNHRYSNYDGIQEFKLAVAAYYENHYGVALDPDTEVLALIGSKEGIANMVQAVINPGDTVLVPDPGYPVYRTAVHLAGGETEYVSLDQQNGYIPQLENVSKSTRDKAKLLFLNYPSNPTSATVDINVFLKAITFVEKNNMLLAHDAAYDLVTFAGYQAPSVLQVPGAKEHAIEFGSLSKSFNMTGWRIGYVVGNKQIIQAIATLKSNIDTCQFIPVQKAAAVALRSDLFTVKQNNEVFQKRMEVLHHALEELGMHAEKPRGSIFLWAKIPSDFTSIAFADFLLEKAGIIVTPGNAFGPSGEGFVRIALSVTIERINEVIRRLRKLDFRS